MVEWRQIKWAPGYDVSDGGQIRSWLPERNFAPVPTTPRLRKLAVDKDGYHKVTFAIGGARKDARVCALVAEAWHGPRPQGAVARHLDGSRTNDTPANVVWGTPQENSDDSNRHGTQVRGSQVNTSRLSAEAVAVIKASALGHSALARIYGVTPSAICHIRKGRAWNHVST
jgi:hypothetical protein